LFPVLSSWGATGLLIEWEDTFPYVDDLAAIGSLGNGLTYTQEEVDRIYSLAEQNNLTAVPLVQTFGHLEFVLRHEKWKCLREVENYPSSLCPNHPDAVKLVTSMVNQVIARSPKSLQYFHIGADEVWHLGMCFSCNEQDKQLLFLSHVTTVLRLLRQHHPHLKWIMWDDMLRSIDSRLLTEYGLGDLVDPMVWIYDSSATFHLSDDLWQKYTSVFRNIWVASAYKGATGSFQILPILEHHVGNHVQWVDTIRKQRPLKINLHGIAITGWSRYDHYATLCELLPTALPTLALCLSVWKNCGYAPALHKEVATALGYVKVPLLLSPYPRPQPVAAELNFPGWKIAVGVEWFANLHGKHLNIINCDQISTWMNPWQIKHNFTNPMQIESLVNSLFELDKEWTAFEVYMTNHMSEAYYDAVIDEWLYTHVHSAKSAVKQLHKAGERQLAQAANKTSQSSTLFAL
ncbi:hypothetical protein AAG570_004438, partial [Ranatra chinensis]